MVGFVIKLNYGGEEVWARRGIDPRHVSSEYHPEIIDGRNADRDLPAKGLLTQDINATTHGGSG